MNKHAVVRNIQAVVTRKAPAPTSLMWNRLEGRPRRTDFSRALKAEVRDPLWMITRQWQMGEFQGDDAGSPVIAKVAWRADPVQAVRIGDATPKPLDPNVPLEATVESRPAPVLLDGRAHNAQIRASLGRRWQKLLEANGHADLLGDFRNNYGFNAPNAASPSDYPTTAHAGTWQTMSALAGRAIDGLALLAHLTEPGAAASDNLGLVDPKKSQVDQLGVEFLQWAARTYVPPESDGASWKPRHLEYDFEVSAPNGSRPASLRAAEYRGGRLDWYHFEAALPNESEKPSDAVLPSVSSFIPTAIQFEGMPHTRHWTFEEGATNFGDIRPDTTDVAKLLLIEFGLVYANDWFLLPIELPAGSLTAIVGLAVTNVFGERTWIQPAITQQGPTTSWRMFRMTEAGGTDDRLFLTAAAPAGLESSPVEAVSFVRDEVSNMVWGIETTVQLVDGTSRPGREVGYELRQQYQSALPPPPPAPATEAKVQYSLMRWEAEHWIPFVPAHLPDDNREIQLQRAAMPRLLEGEVGVTPAKIRPRTRLLREGLDDSSPKAYYIAEEEVERAGTVIESKWQRCRWYDGRVVLWYSNQRKTGRGEAASGLAFDILAPKRQ